MTTREEALSAEIKHLLLGVSQHSARHLTEIETDLVQTTFLLSEAIEKLSASFMAIHASACAQQQLVDSLLASVPASPGLLDNFKYVQGELNQHVNEAVTGLQFQDMTSQLIGRTITGINGVRDILVILSAHCNGIAAGGKIEEMIVWFDNMNKLLEEQNSKLTIGLRKAVYQTHMESGDIELF